MSDLDETELKDLVGRLPRSIEPPSDAWPEIRGRLVAARARRQVELPLGLSGRGVRVLAAASLVLLVGGAGLVVHAVDARSAQTALAEDWEPALQPWDVAPGSTRPADVERFRQQLRTIVDEESHNLGPATMATLKQNLAIIDDAIRQVDDALRKDPASATLRARLLRAYQAQASLVRLAWQSS
jgi:autotransporter adhesin